MYPDADHRTIQLHGEHAGRSVQRKGKAKLCFELIRQSVRGMMEELFPRYAATSIARQLALGDFIAGRPWNINIPAATIAFGDNQEDKFAIQLLGSHATGDDSWLWAWANYQSRLPATIIKDSETLKDRAKELNDLRLSTGSWIMGKFDSHALGIVCRGLLGADAYYRCPNRNGGALIVMIYGLPPSVTAPVTPLRAITVLGQVISNYSVPHRDLALSFFEQQGYSVELTDTSITATPAESTAATLIIGFDAHDRMTKFSTIVAGGPPTEVDVTTGQRSEDAISDDEEEDEEDSEPKPRTRNAPRPGAKAKGKLALFRRYAKK